MRSSLFLFFLIFSSILLGQSIDTRDVVRIPVVVHILYTSELQNISTEQIMLQIEALNKDFSRTNDNYNATPEYFKNFSANMEIQFCLATKDENGNVSSGITRTETGINEIGNTELYFKSDEGGHNPWDSDKFVNIWVADFGNTGILGVTPLPGEASPSSKDGILVNYKYFGVDGEHQDENRKRGKVLTHEMGHYFGLGHIWGSLNTMCQDDDEITDTPLQSEPTFGCPSFPAPDECTQGNGIMYCNFMDYTDDACLTMFTAGQKVKAYEILNGVRSELLESASATCITPTEIDEVHSFQVYPNPATENITLLFDNSNEKRLIRLYDMHGQLILLAEAKNQVNTINTINLEAGFYLLHAGETIRKVLITR